MSPASDEKQLCFAVRRGDIKERINPAFFAQGHQKLVNELRAIALCRTLGSLISEGAFGVLPPGTSYVKEGGIRFLRATELLVDNKIGWQACLRAPIEFARHTRAILKAGDILIAVKGATIASEKSVCTVEQLDEPTIVNGSIFRFQVNEDTSPSFLLEILSSAFMKKQIKGSLILNNAVDYLSRTVIDGLVLPLPSKDIQQALAAEMNSARQARKEKLAKADELLADIDYFLLGQLDLIPPAEDARQYFAIRLGQMKGRRFDPPAYRPYYKRDEKPSTNIVPLRELASINCHTIAPPQNMEELVPYVGLPECDLTEVREVVMRPYREVKGRRIFREGDILFARIEPSVFNKKYVFVDDLKGYEYAYTSTEFYIVTPKRDVNPLYLYAMFSCSFVFSQVIGKTTGSSGRRRIDPGLFATLQIPDPGKEKRDLIADEILLRRTTARRLREEAEQDWETAKAHFEAQLLGEGGQIK